MITREDLCDWVVEALRTNGGRASIVQICEYIWRKHKKELRSGGDLFYTWQYDMRWAGLKLRKAGILKPSVSKKKAPWELN